jgi:hypothetical protein
MMSTHRRADEASAHTSDSGARWTLVSRVDLAEVTMMVLRRVDFARVETFALCITPESSALVHCETGQSFDEFSSMAMECEMAVGELTL